MCLVDVNKGYMRNILIVYRLDNESKQPRGKPKRVTKLLTPPDDEGSAGEPKRKIPKKNKKKRKEKGESTGAAPAPSAAAATGEE